MQYEDIKVMVAATLFFMVGATIWYQAWVKPRDQFMYAVMDCMNEINDYSEEAYVFCGRTTQDMLNESR